MVNRRDVGRDASQARRKFARRDFRHYFQLRGLASILAFGLSIPLSIYYFETGAIAACAAGWLLAVVGTTIRLVRNTK